MLDMQTSSFTNASDASTFPTQICIINGHLARAFVVRCAFPGALGWFQDAFHSLAGAPDNPAMPFSFAA